MLEDPLLTEFGETLTLVRSLRERVLANPMTPTARGGARVHPNAIVLRDAQAHLIRLARLLSMRKRPVIYPRPRDDELARLLD